MFSLRIARPIQQQIDEAIQETWGRANCPKTIHVDGPRDPVYFGERLDWMRRRLLKLQDEQKTRFLQHVSQRALGDVPPTAMREGADLHRGVWRGRRAERESNSAYRKRFVQQQYPVAEADRGFC